VRDDLNAGLVDHVLHGPPRAGLGNRNTRHANPCENSGLLDELPLSNPQVAVFFFRGLRVTGFGGSPTQLKSETLRENEMEYQQETTLSREKIDEAALPSEVGLRACDEPQLKFGEQCVLALIELDPRLTYDRQRLRLREIAKLFHPRLGHNKVGRSLGELKVLNREGKLTTAAFNPQTRDAPNLQRAIEVINGLGMRCGWAEHSSEELQVRRIKVLRLLGHVVPPRMYLASDVRGS